MRQDRKSETSRKAARGARPDPAGADLRSQGGEGSRRVQGYEPKEPHYDSSGRWAERSADDPNREEQKGGGDESRQRFARGTEWNFRPDADGAGKTKKH